jgi:hypothetical protein
MRVVLASTLVWTMFVTAPETQSTAGARPSGSLERPFTMNGQISMDLSAGEYRIAGTPDHRIHLDWSARDRETLSRIRARADIRGREATITTDGPGNSRFRMAIQVPARADLHIRLTAGELTIEGIEGNKDVALHAGELNIDVGPAGDYGRVEASVWAGEVDAAPYQVNTGGLFRSFDWRGQGPYRLEARLKAGEVRLYSTVIKTER